MKHVVILLVLFLLVTITGATGTPECPLDNYYFNDVGSSKWSLSYPLSIKHSNNITIQIINIDNVWKPTTDKMRLKAAIGFTSFGNGQLHDYKYFIVIGG
eukprot:36199_1